MRTPAESLTVSLVQTDLIWEDPAANRAAIEKMVRSVQEKMEILVLPEMFNTGFTMNVATLSEEMSGSTVSWMKSLAADRKIIVAGSLIIHEDGKYFNRMIWMQPDGKAYHYDKRHLFGYAGEDENFDAGNKRVIVSVKGWRVNLQVCYDLRFPVWARQQPLNSKDGEISNVAEYDVLIYAANWPERRSHAWKTLLQARAIENQCYVVGVNRIGKDGKDIMYSGDSMVADPLGTVLFSAGAEAGIFTYVLTLDNLYGIRNRLPFLKDADPFIIGVPKQV